MRLFWYRKLLALSHANSTNQKTEKPPFEKDRPYTQLNGKPARRAVNKNVRKGQDSEQAQAQHFRRVT